MLSASQAEAIDAEGRFVTRAPDCGARVSQLSLHTIDRTEFPGTAASTFLLHADRAVSFQKGAFYLSWILDTLLAQSTQQLVHCHKFPAHIAPQYPAVLDE